MKTYLNLIAEMQSVLKEMSSLAAIPAPQPDFPTGTRVRLSRTYSNRDQYGTVVKGRFTSRGNVYVSIPGDAHTIDYAPENLDMVSEREFSRNVTLQVGDTVRLQQHSTYAGECAKIRSIKNDITVEFDTYDDIRARCHAHKPGEPYGHVWSTGREWLEFVGNPNGSGCIST